MKIDVINSRKSRIESLNEIALSLSDTQDRLERLLDRADDDADLDVEPCMVADLAYMARRLAAQVKLLSDGAA